MTLLGIAGRLLKGPGHSQPLYAARDCEPIPRCSVERASSPLHLTSPESDSDYGDMVGNALENPISQSLHAPPWAKTRPLSDIRELTEPSLAETIPRRLLSDNLPRSSSRTEVSRKTSAVSKRRPGIDTCHGENREPERKNSIESNSIGFVHRERSSRTPSPPSPADNNSISSIYSIPPKNVPPRSSSRTRARSTSRPRNPQIPPPLPSQQALPLASKKALPLPPRSSRENDCPLPQSSARYIAAHPDTIFADSNQHIYSKTFARQPLSKDMLEFPTHRHPRIELGLDLSAGIFVGGGSIEGTVQIHVDDAERIRHRRTLDIARISIDLLGIEEMTGNRRSIFLNLATELIDQDNPPPTNMVMSRDPIGCNDLFWHLMPSSTNLAFSLTLPLNVGPPPFQSRNARIRYALSVSLLIRDHGKQYIVRTSEDVTVLSVYDRRLQPFARFLTLTWAQLRRLSCLFHLLLPLQTSGSRPVRDPSKSSDSQLASTGKSGSAGQTSMLTCTLPTIAAKRSKN
jgi:hypothetical protein